MAYDKVVDSVALDNELKIVGDAIRGKNGESKQYSIAEMATAINAIVAGGGGNTGAKYRIHTCCLPIAVSSKKAYFTNYADYFNTTDIIGFVIQWDIGTSIFLDSDYFNLNEGQGGTKNIISDTNITFKPGYELRYYEGDNGSFGEPYNPVYSWNFNEAIGVKPVHKSVGPQVNTTIPGFYMILKDLKK